MKVGAKVGADPAASPTYLGSGFARALVSRKLVSRKCLQERNAVSNLSSRSFEGLQQLLHRGTFVQKGKDMGVFSGCCEGLLEHVEGFFSP